MGTGEATAKPVRINATIGDVTNAEGLVDPSKGPARLTYSGHRPGAGDHPRLRPRGRRPAVLRRERGTPAGGATSVTLRAAYSEAREFLWTPGNTDAVGSPRPPATRT